MDDQVEKILKDTRKEMNRTISHLESELGKIRAGRMSTQLVDGIMVDYYDNPTPINQVANVSVPDARTLTIQPWEKHLLQEIEKAILAANIGMTPQNDGEQIRLFMPPMTEESRKEFVKRSNAAGEQAKISIRNSRKDAMDRIKKLKSDDISEDVAKKAEGDVQGITDGFTKKIDQYCAAKEEQIMTV